MRVLSLFLVFLTGLAGGWLMRDWMVHDTAPARDVARPEAPEVVTEPPALESLLEAGEFHRVVAALDGDTRRLKVLADKLPRGRAMILMRTFNDVHGESFTVTMSMAELQAHHNNFQEAVDLLLRAAVLVGNETQQSTLEHRLDTVTEARARQLKAAEDFAGVDSLYQMITLSLPEQAEYYLKLGEFRMRLGDFAAALIPLSHIANDHRWGERARELMAQAEASEVFDGRGQEQLGLRRQGGQFIVEAVIDHGRSVNLLIDTGATMTMIDAQMLEQLGYSLGDRRQEYFSTINGVIEAPVVSLGHLGLGRSGIRELPVGGLPLGLPNGIDGLLGMNFLRHYEFRIDQNSNVLHLDTDHWRN